MCSNLARMVNCRRACGDRIQNFSFSVTRTILFFLSITVKL